MSAESLEVLPDPGPATAATIRDARPTDLEAIAGIERTRSGAGDHEWWAAILNRYVGDDPEQVALVATDETGTVVAYLFGEVRAWEFGSERCGWIFALAVDPDHDREGTATALYRRAVRSFHEAGVELMRTMVRRDAVPILSFFRSLGFAAGPFSELEKAIDRYDLDADLEGPEGEEHQT
jgi:ribosomal protein S18 acetylase RimI-like enzyme